MITGQCPSHCATLRLRLFLSLILALSLVTISVIPFSRVMSASPSLANTASRPPVTRKPMTSGSEMAAKTLEAYGKAGLNFEENRGQTDDTVKFLARGAGYTLFLTPAEAVFVLASQTDAQIESTQRKRLEKGDAAETERVNGTVTPPAVLRMKLEGANSQPTVSGLDELEGKVNYFIGNDSAKWHTDVPTFARVSYEGVYPGIGMVYYGNQQQLEYDFEVAPGADYNQIDLSFAGADRVNVDEVNGDLLLSVGEGTLRQPKPAVYQEVDGTRVEIESGYVMKGTNRVGFTVGAFDVQRPLIIDPVLAYSTYVGGSSVDNGRGIAVDAEGNAYVTGNTLSTNFPTTNAVQGAHAGDEDAFVMKLNASGSAFLYSTYLGGSSTDNGASIAIDSAGNAYVAGPTSSIDFPTANAVQRTYGGGSFDAFVTKLNSNGSAFLYSTYVGGSASDSAAGIATDADGNAYVTGITQSTNFPISNAVQGTLATIQDAFVTKLNTNGSALIYSTYLGGNSSDSGAGIAVDSAGNAYVAGTTSATDFPVVNPAQGTNGGSQDAFVTKLNANGSAFLYSTYLGGSSSDLGVGIAVDSAGNAYVTGFTTSTNFPTANAVQRTYGGGSFDAFVTKLNTSGSAFLYSTYLGGSDSDTGSSIAADSAGNAYVIGSTSSTNFPISNAVQGSFSGNGDAFVTKLNANGSARLYSTYLGGSNADAGGGIAVDSSGNAYVAGSTSSTNFPVTADSFQPAGGTLGDGFIAKLGDYAIAGRVLDASNSGITGVTVTLSGASSATAITDSNGDFSFPITISGGNYTVTPFKTDYNFTPASVNIASLNSNQALIFIGGSTAPNPSPTPSPSPSPSPTPTPTPTPASVQFSATSFSVTEGAGSAQIIVTRSGDTSRAVTVDYATTDGTANDRGDYTTAIGTLHFAAGDTAKSFNVFVTDDVFAEGNETVQLTLSNPSSGAQITGSAVVVLTIVDDDLANGTANPIDSTQSFVRQHYIDFLNREPDPSGLAFWTNNIDSCGSDPGCRQAKRIDTSAAFFLSIEFQNTGFLVERTYRVAFNRLSAYREFIRDTQAIGRGVIIGQPGADARLEANKQACFSDYVARADFISIYGGLSNEQYVDALNANTDGALTASDRNALVAGLNNATETRSTVLRKIVENATFTSNEFNRAFVLMQYFGYLRRNPNDAPDTNFDGFNFWLDKLNSFGGDFRKAEMIKAFISSNEYRQRFGQP